MQVDYLVVGAGLFGCVIANRIAHYLKKKVLVIDIRNHIGGNCYTEKCPQSGVEFNKYGTHIFHTSDEIIYKFIKQFTKVIDYKLEVLGRHNHKYYPIPINLETINEFFGVSLNAEQGKDLIRKEIERAKVNSIQTLEDKALSIMGRRLYEAFVRPFVIKHWAIEPQKLLPENFSMRFSVRFNESRNYYPESKFQFLPSEGYNKFFDTLVDSKLIELELGLDYFKIRDQIKVKYKTIYTGNIDQFFQYRFGKLTVHGINYTREVSTEINSQGCPILNYCDMSTHYTRTHEPRHLFPHKYRNIKANLFLHEYTTLDIEDSIFTYPVDTIKNRFLFGEYQRLANRMPKVVFGGRMSFPYQDMSDTIRSALSAYNNQIIS